MPLMCWYYWCGCAVRERLRPLVVVDVILVFALVKIRPYALSALTAVE